MNSITSWYVKLAVVGGVIGASMELFMNYTGFYDKVVTLEAQQRAEALEAAKSACEINNEDAEGVKVKQSKVLGDKVAIFDLMVMISTQVICKFSQIPPSYSFWSWRHYMDEEKVKVVALAVHALASMVEYAVVMAVQYMEIIGDDSVSDQVRQGCISILAQLDAIQASAIFLNKRKRKRKVKFRSRKRALDLFTMYRGPSQDTYQQMFKMDMDTFQWFCEQVGPHVEKMNTNYKRSIPVTTRVAVAVFRLATGANYLIAAERFSVGESTVFYCTMELCQILCNHFKHMVAYPQGASVKKVMAGFEAISGLPNCVGAIDCMHLRIKRPAGPQGADYLNQDKVYTIVTQAAVDASTRVLSLATGFTGAVPDVSVLGLSSLYDNIKSGRFFNVPPVDIEGVNIPSYLVGDSNYQLKPWLMLPYPGEELTAFEDTFNRGHSQIWDRVDKTFETLKSWGILTGVLQVDVPTAIYMIGAVCIMHNMLLDKSDPSKEGAWDEDFMLDASRLESVVPVYPEDEVSGDPLYAKAIRDALATYLITM